VRLGLPHLTLTLLLASGATSALAQRSSSQIYRSAYFLGRGDTGVSVADDEEAIFYNPAGVALGKGIYKKTVLASPHIEVSQATRDLGRQLAAEDADAVEAVRDHVGKPNHVGISNFTGLILRRAAIGAVATSTLDVLAYKSPEGGGLEEVTAAADQTVGLTFTLAESFWSERMLLGVTGKYLARGRGEATASLAEADALEEQVADRENFLGAGEGGGADVGVMFRGGGRSNPALGITVNDVGDTKIAPTEPTAIDLDVKQTVNVGVSIEPGTKFSKLRLLADVRDVLGRVETNDRKKLHLGAELTVLNAVGVTGGLNQGYPTGGVYFDLYVLRLDLGMYTEEMGDRVGTRPDTRFFFRLKAGF
jgi:hypothetical protein